MIVVDTSALMAVVLDEADAAGCAAVLEATTDILISAGTLAETLIVAGHRGVGAAMAGLLEGLGLQVAPVTATEAADVAAAHAAWGKGVHPAGLNFGDCFAYALARRSGRPLLFVGQDFARTDIPACPRPEIAA
jgi:ribonuclease VapC